MQENNVIIFKGTYDYYQQGAFFHVKDYIVTLIDGKKCLLLRFANNSHLTVNKVQFKLTQYDVHGKVISTKTCVYDDLYIRGEKEHALKSGIIVSDDFADFRIVINCVTSGVYKFIFRNGLAIQKYDPRGYRNEKYKKQNKGKMSVVRTPNASRMTVKGTSLIVILAIIMALATALISNQSIFGKQEGAQFNNYSRNQIEVVSDSKL